MLYNNKNNHYLVEELNDVIAQIKSLDEENTNETLYAIEHQLNRIDKISQELNAPDLRALSHWMILNLDLNSNNQKQIEELIKSGDYYHWIVLLSSLLEEYNQALLPKLYNSLVKPNWLMKPSIPILKNFARWIDISKAQVTSNQPLSVIEEPADSIHIDAKQNEETKKLSDVIAGDSEIKATAVEDQVEEQKYVFEEIDESILEKDYTTQPVDIVGEFKDSNELSDEPLPQVVSEKSSNYYDDIALTDSPYDTLSDDYQDSQLIEEPVNKVEESESFIVDGYDYTDTTDKNYSSHDSEKSIPVDSVPDDVEIQSIEEINQELEDEFNIEVEDIVMSLSTISNSAAEISPISSQINNELKRLESLSVLFGYKEILIVSSWCRHNITLFNENPTIENNQFVTNSESWAWIELVNACLLSPDDLSYFSSLSTELNRPEWIEPLNVEDLQNLLLFLRNPNKKNNTAIPENVVDAEPDIIESTDIITEVIESEESKFKLSWNEDTHPELLAAYFEETPNIVTDVMRLLLKVASDDSNKGERHTASRLAHTIKGGSAVLGINGLTDYAYQLEQILDYSTNNKLSEETKGLLREASACLGDTFEAVQKKGQEPKELASVFTKLKDYADTLEDDSDNLELSSPKLPDFISSAPEDSDQQNEKDIINIDTNFDNETLSKEIINEVESVDLIDIINPEIIDDVLINSKDEVTNLINTDTDSDINSLDSELNDFNTEIDDITMSLASICNDPDKVFDHIDQYNQELQRLDLLADVSGYLEITKISQWCQENLTKFAQTPNDTNKHFIASGEAWSWIELVGASMADPEEISHLSSLNTELTRDEWVESLPIDTIQKLLLLLRSPSTSEDVDSSVNQILHKSTETGGGVSLEIDNIIPDTDEITADTSSSADIDTSKNSNNEERNFITTEDETTYLEDTVDDHGEVEQEVTINQIKIESNAEKQLIQETASPAIISWDSDVHPELLSVYFQETPDQITEVAALLHKISNGDANKKDHQHAARIAHTIKGASGVLGIDSLVKLTHQLEDILDYSVNNELSQESSELLAESSDCLESLFEAIQNKQAIPEEYDSVLSKVTESAKLITDTDSDSLELDLGKPSLPSFIVNNNESKETEIIDQEISNDAITDTLIAPIEELVALSQSNQNTIDTNEAQIRVPVRVIDNLLNLAGELVTSSSQVSDKIGKTLDTRKNIKEQDKRVHKMLRELSSTIDQQEKNQASRLASIKDSDFDSLEMDTYNELHSVIGLLTESILDSETIEESLGKQLGDINGYLRTTDRLNKELSEVILSSRMVSVNNLVPRLERIVRETCRKTDKKAELIVTGNDINIDTDIINGLVDPLLHLLRNAIDHGIELPEDRLTNNKDEQGLINLDFKRQGNFIQMKLIDDGKGINPEAIYQHAIEKGLITPEQEFSTQETLKLILKAGFTTQNNLSDISGRGVGMDVVKSAIENMKGSLEISSEVGEGTTFSIRIPLNLITSATLLVRASDNQIAIPSDSIEQLYYLSPDKVITKNNDHYIKHKGQEIVIQSLSKLLGWPAKKINYDLANMLVLIKADDKTHAVHIDEIIHSREVVIKKLSPWIDGRNGIVGACHLPDGSVAPVMNLPLLLSLTEETNSIASDDDSWITENTKDDLEVPQILVVDDSLSNRKALSLIIEQTEYNVVTAVDGLDALNIMNEQAISMVFTDLEMPRMNGLEFTQSVRAWKEYQHIPVIMVTSRTTSKHRQLAEKAGVNDYLTKPVVTDTLLDSLEQWINQDASVVA